MARRDEVDLDQIASLGLPFWLAGGVASPAHLVEARAAGAAGIQVGTAFALCAESGLAPGLRARVLAVARAGTAGVVTDPRASPSGYPFKVVQLEGTLSEPAVYARRERRCDVGLLRTPVVRPDGGIAYRCPSEPADAYVRKGGKSEDTIRADVPVQRAPGDRRPRAAARLGTRTADRDERRRPRPPRRGSGREGQLDCG